MLCGWVCGAWCEPQEVADALNGAPNQGIACNVTPSALHDLDPAALAFHKAAAAAVLAPVPTGEGAGATYFADANAGSDSNPGTQSAPFQTVGKGVAACRSPGAAPCVLYLRAGTYYQPQTIQLSVADSGLTISGVVLVAVLVVGGWVGRSVGRRGRNPKSPLWFG